MSNDKSQAQKYIEKRYVLNNTTSEIILNIKCLLYTYDFKVYKKC